MQSLYGVLDAELRYSIAPTSDILLQAYSRHGFELRCWVSSERTRLAVNVCIYYYNTSSPKPC